MRKIQYDPSRISLYHPEVGDTIFKAAMHPSEELRCAEACRLVYRKFERQNAAGDQIRRALGHAGFTEVRKPSRLITYGSPRVGDSEFVSTLGGVEISTYVDCCDIVTQLPPQIAGFSHCGQLRYIDRMGNISA